LGLFFIIFLFFGFSLIFSFSSLEIILQSVINELFRCFFLINFKFSKFKITARIV